MNSADQLDDNLKTAEISTPGMFQEKESAVFAPVVAAIREVYKVPCTGCNYCMPCPKGVDIPNCFAAYNTSYAIGYVSGLILHITGMGVNSPEKNHGAKKCVKCRACEQKCPQHIEISTSMTAVAKRMEPIWFNALMSLMRKILR